MPVWVAGRRVYVNTQRTQTVKICTPQNTQGVYERYYRIEPPYVLPQQQMELTVSRFATLVDLEQWLVNDRHAQREPQNEARGSSADIPTLPPIVPTVYQPTLASTLPQAIEDDDSDLPEPEVPEVVAEVLDLLSSARYFPDEDSWLPKAKDLVEQSIDRLVQEFLEQPYLHRVEHSIHAELFHIMMSHSELAQRVSLGSHSAKTQLVHKEWPESIARRGNRRGNFDLVVLTPDLLKGCPSIRAFREGHLHAPIVIEMGLDYDAKHLAMDAKKLMNSKPKHGYLIHFVRELPREPVAEQIILGIEEKFGIKTAFAWTAGGRVAVKLVNEKSITER